VDLAAETITIEGVDFGVDPPTVTFDFHQASRDAVRLGCKGDQPWI
jgi:hypothetical protein